MRGLFAIAEGRPPAGSRAQIAICSVFSTWVVPRNEMCGCPSASAYDTMTGALSAMALPMASFISSVSSINDASLHPMCRHTCTVLSTALGGAPATEGHRPAAVRRAPTPRRTIAAMTAPPSPRGDWRGGLPAGVARDGLPEVRAVQHDHRRVEAGDLFVCVIGERFDGHDFASAAVEAGAVAVLTNEGRSAALGDLGVPVVEVPDTRVALAGIAAAHEGYPGRQLQVVGITGTDGKSTTAFMVAAALEACGATVGLLTTVESRVAGRPVEGLVRLTTQEAPVIQRLLAEMVEAGCTHAVVEATSHGLELHRLDHCDFNVAVLTNLSGDHLDFHGTLEAYRKAKGRLFEMLNEQRHDEGQRYAVLNADDPSWRYFAARTRARAVTYALDDEDADVRASDVALWPDGATFLVATEEEEVEASVRLPGRFNVANALAAITAAAALGFDANLAAAGVAGLRGVPGRMERVPGAPFEVVVDYAHTADALRKVLDTLRPVVEGRLIVVFGCAGERSRDRRSGLGRVAAEAADLAVLTEEDPRSEPSEAIIDEIAQAMLAAGAIEGFDASDDEPFAAARFERVPDRREAIGRALDLARPGDLVLLAGKGHEQTIERADGPHPWDDRRAAREAIAERFGAAG
ncbi:MAG: UDP-N-acetylmuramoyl-L-alanyl-D-glutamate--2,6-diaminopimelate ligase [Dehalococcoidia bacterium]|nr:UDP-N-acetylmuramoyl-L-alanyl-D-glutamate--2,6-diaminopimelate ligase [Dehalococcoidia bacterium]